jgi:hypothetical protein
MPRGSRWKTCCSRNWKAGSTRPSGLPLTQAGRATIDGMPRPTRWTGQSGGLRPTTTPTTAASGRSLFCAYWSRGQDTSASRQASEGRRTRQYSSAAVRRCACRRGRLPPVPKSLDSYCSEPLKVIQFEV